MPAADRVREYREPFAGARIGTAARDVDPGGFGSGTVAAATAIADRERFAVAAGRGCRPGLRFSVDRAFGDARAGASESQRYRYDGADRFGFLGVSVHGWGRAFDRTRNRSSSGLAGSACRLDGGTERKREIEHRESIATALPQFARRRGSGALGNSTGVGRTSAAQLRRVAAGESGRAGGSRSDYGVIVA